MMTRDAGRQLLVAFRWDGAGRAEGVWSIF